MRAFDAALATLTSLLLAVILVVSTVRLVAGTAGPERIAETPDAVADAAAVTPAALARPSALATIRPCVEIPWDLARAR